MCHEPGTHAGRRPKFQAGRTLLPSCTATQWSCTRWGTPARRQMRCSLARPRAVQRRHAACRTCLPCSGRGPTGSQGQHKQAALCWVTLCHASIEPAWYPITPNTLPHPAGCAAGGTVCAQMNGCSSVQRMRQGSDRSLAATSASQTWSWLCTTVLIFMPASLLCQRQQREPHCGAAHQIQDLPGAQDANMLERNRDVLQERSIGDPNIGKGQHDLGVDAPALGVLQRLREVSAQLVSAAQGSVGRDKQAVGCMQARSTHAACR